MSVPSVTARLLACALPVLLAPAARAQEATPVDSLSLATVYAMVDRASPRVRVAEAAERAAIARIAPASRPPDPSLQLGLMNYLLPDLGADPVLGMRQVQVMQMVPLPGKLAAMTAAARGRATAAGARADEVRLEARAAAAMAFLERWGAERQAALAEETRRLLEDAAGVATAMYKVGDGRQADVLRAQVEVARMEEMAVRMRAMSATALARLAAVVDTPSVVVAAAPRVPLPPDSLPAPEALAAQAVLARPMLRAGTAEVEAAEAQARLADRERWPDPQVGVQYATRGTPMGVERMGSLMVGATIPLWARARQHRMREEAGAMRTMAEADVAAMRAETRGRVAEAHTAIASSRRLVALYRSAVLPQAEAAAQSALAAYRAGAVDFMTVVENRMTVNTYRQQLVALEVTELAAWVELEMLLARPLLAPAGGR